MLIINENSNICAPAVEGLKTISRTSLWKNDTCGVPKTLNRQLALSDLFAYLCYHYGHYKCFNFHCGDSLPTGHTTLLRHWINVLDFYSTSQQRRVPSGFIFQNLTSTKSENIYNGRRPIAKVWLLNRTSSSSIDGFKIFSFEIIHILSRLFIFLFQRNRLISEGYILLLSIIE